MRKGRKEAMERCEIERNNDRRVKEGDVEGVFDSKAIVSIPRAHLSA